MSYYARQLMELMRRVKDAEGRSDDSVLLLAPPCLENARSDTEWDLPSWIDFTRASEEDKLLWKSPGIQRTLQDPEIKEMIFSVMPPNLRVYRVKACSKFRKTEVAHLRGLLLARRPEPYVFLDGKLVRPSRRAVERMEFSERILEQFQTMTGHPASNRPAEFFETLANGAVRTCIAQNTGCNLLQPTSSHLGLTLMVGYLPDNHVELLEDRDGGTRAVFFKTGDAKACRRLLIDSVCKLTLCDSSCANPGCPALNPSKKCCGDTAYCTNTCQRADWPRHRQECTHRRDKAAQATMAAGGQAAGGEAAGGEAAGAQAAGGYARDVQPDVAETGNLCPCCGKPGADLQCLKCHALYCSKKCRHLSKGVCHKRPQPLAGDSHGAPGA